MSHLSSIGFAVNNEFEFRSLILLAANSGDEIEATNGNYVVWSPGEGIQLWAEKDKENRIIGCNPHFEGTGRMRVEVTDLHPRENRSMDGSLYGWADPTDDTDPDSGLYPCLIDAPDFDVVQGKLAIPSIVTMQIAAFAYEIKCYKDAKEFEELQPGREENGKGTFAPESFLPIGLFDGQKDAEALFTGSIEEHRLAKNPLTGLEFHAMSIKTLGGVIDVVADPNVVEGEPIVGAIIQGVFWLSGRIVED